MAGRELTTREADQLSEYLVLQLDLQVSLELLDLRQRITSSNKDSNAIKSSLFRDAVIQFVGCFGKAPPKLQKNEVYSSEDGSLNAFELTMDLRNGYAAHNFGPLRQIMIAALRADPSVPANTEVASMTMVYAGPPEDDASLQQLISVALDHVVTMTKPLWEIAAAQAKGLSEEEYLRLPIARQYPVEPRDFRISRDRHTKTRRETNRAEAKDSNDAAKN